MTRAPPRGSRLVGVTWLLFAVLSFRFLTVWSNAFLGLSLPVLGKIGFTLLFAAFALLHAITVLGFNRALAFAATSAVVTWSFEEVGILSGAIYGRYHYSDQLGAKLGAVPVVIPFAWFMMIYASWTVAGLILRNRRAPGRWSALFMRISVAAMAMTAWDTVMDPGMARAGVWTWEDGGAYFGVPLQNFAGWLVTTGTVYAACELILARMPGGPTERIGGRYAGLPAILYGLMAVDRVLLPDLPELRIVAAFGMGLAALLAVVGYGAAGSQDLPSSRR